MWEICLLIGASLSEPHTSVTSLRACVCMLVCLLAWTDHIPEILNMRFHLHVHNSNSNSKRSMESSSSCSSTPMGLPSVSTTMELLSAKERLRLEREGRATARLHARCRCYIMYIEQGWKHFPYTPVGDYEDFGG